MLVVVSREACVVGWVIFVCVVCWSPVVVCCFCVLCCSVFVVCCVLFTELIVA